MLRLQTADSIEEKVWQAAKAKLDMADKFVSGGLFDRDTDAKTRCKSIDSDVCQKHVDVCYAAYSIVLSRASK